LDTGLTALGCVDASPLKAYNYFYVSLFSIFTANVPIKRRHNFKQRLGYQTKLLNLEEEEEDQSLKLALGQPWV